MIPPSSQVCRQQLVQLGLRFSERNTSSPTRLACGFSLSEILVVIAIGSVLALLLVSLGGRLMESARQVNCASNLRNLANGVLGYAAEHSGQLPANSVGRGNEARYWMDFILPYVAGDGAKRQSGTLQPFGSSFYCPSSKKPHPYGSYAPNPYLVGVADWPGLPPSKSLASIPNPAATILFSECYDPRHPAWDSSWYFPYGQANENFLPRPHRDTLNMVFCDGHLSNIKHKDAVRNYRTLLGTDSIK